MPARTPDEPSGDLWRALADPTRRAVLDLLRDRAMTTGEVAARFPDLSRFAVMKHLAALTGAGLVVVTRDGRERWNRLNPVPLRAVVRRWLDPFAAAAADALLKLKQTAETPTEDSPMPATATQPVGSYALTAEVAVAAPPARVWKALTRDTAKWWPKHFYTTDDPKGFVVEGRPGGRVYEDWGDGGGAAWGTIAVWQPPAKMVWACEMFPGWGGPGRSFVTFTVEAAGDGSVVRLHDAGVCPDPGKASASLADGWRELIGDHLKPFVEGGGKGAKG